MDIGSAIPIPYEIYTITLSQNPFSTKLLATHLAAYAPDLSTLVGSFPENAPPP